MKSEQSVDKYINRLPQNTREKLVAMRNVIEEVLPSCEETISYGIPTFKMYGSYVVYIAGFKNHVSLYPATEELPKELDELLKHKTGKGTFQFPLDKELPLSLIKKFTEFRLKKVEEKKVVS